MFERRRCCVWATFSSKRASCLLPFSIRSCYVQKMNSLGSSSKWPSYDSLPSTSSCIHSESEQTDDETEFVSEGEVDSGTSKSLSAGGGRYLELNEPHVRSDGDHQHEQQTDRSLHPSSASLPATAPLGSSSATPGDLVFAQKCVNLRRFVRPLLGLLHGLKTGRFDKGLSRFQQSVATDRLQRILGVLKRPDMGEKYLQNLLQIEVMLKMWFPQVAARSAEEPSQTTIPRVPPQWQHNQLHMPVKKRKLSWSGHEHPEEVPAKRQQHKHGKTGSCEADAAFIPGSSENLKAVEPAAPAQGSCTDGPKFTESSNSRNRPPYLGSNRENDNQRRSELSPTRHCDRAAAQDSSVSSSDSFTKSYTP